MSISFNSNKTGRGSLPRGLFNYLKRERRVVTRAPFRFLTMNQGNRESSGNDYYDDYQQQVYVQNRSKHCFNSLEAEFN